MTGLETISWIIGANVGLGSIAMIFASAWVRVSRIDKIEEQIEKLWDKLTRVEVLDTKMTVLEKHIEEIKELILKRS